MNVSTTELDEVSRTFATPILASITTGTLLCRSFSEMHEACEWLLGRFVWTHEFADDATYDRLKAMVLDQHPDFDLQADGIDADNWAPFALHLIEQLGPSRVMVKVPEGEAKTKDGRRIELEPVV